ncbi:hypothetical protein ACVWYN_002072 [Pedobacter sp. UYP24]
MGIVIFGGLITLLFGLSVLFYKVVVNQAIKCFIIPALQKTKYVLKDFGFAGFFNIGDFQEEALSIRPIIANGSVINSIYVFLYVSTANATETFRMTARIETVFFWISKVEYSHELS